MSKSLSYAEIEFCSFFLSAACTKLELRGDFHPVSKLTGSKISGTSTTLHKAPGGSIELQKAPEGSQESRMGLQGIYVIINFDRILQGISSPRNTPQCPAPQHCVGLWRVRGSRGVSHDV